MSLFPDLIVLQLKYVYLTSTMGGLLTDDMFLDLTHYRIGAVPLEACKNHDHKIDKYRFFP
jgi:hypothetical protein